MSLDVYLTAVRPTNVYEGNVTHNLIDMAKAASVYGVLWRPEENGIATAADLIPHLERGLAWLRDNADEAKKYNPANGWGDYYGFRDFLEGYLSACRRDPDATVMASR